MTIEYFQDPCFLELFFSKVAKLNPFFYIRIIVNCGHDKEDKTVSRRPGEKLIKGQRKRLKNSGFFLTHHCSWPNISSYKPASHNGSENTITASSSCPIIGRITSEKGSPSSLESEFVTGEGRSISSSGSCVYVWSMWIMKFKNAKLLWSDIFQ